MQHIKSVTNLKAQWLSNTAAPYIKSPKEIEEERLEKEEKERLKREKIEQKQREKEERRQARRDKKEAARRAKEQRELELLEQARREKEKEEEEIRKQEEWERKMEEKDRQEELERQKNQDEGDLADRLGINGIEFADIDMEEEMVKITTPGPSKWRDALSMRYASYEDDDELPPITPIPNNNDEDKVSLHIDEAGDKVEKKKTEVHSESESVADSKILDDVKYEVDEDLPAEKPQQKSPVRRLLSLGDRSFLAVDDEDYDDLGEDSPMEFEDEEEDDKDDVKGIRREGDGESEKVEKTEEAPSKRKISVDSSSSFTISTPSGSISPGTSLSSFKYGSSVPQQMEMSVDNTIGLDTAIVKVLPSNTAKDNIGFSTEITNSSDMTASKETLVEEDKSAVTPNTDADNTLEIEEYGTPTSLMETPNQSMLETPKAGASDDTPTLSTPADIAYVERTELTPDEPPEVPKLISISSTTRNRPKRSTSRSSTHNDSMRSNPSLDFVLSVITPEEIKSRKERRSSPSTNLGNRNYNNAVCEDDKTPKGEASGGDSDFANVHDTIQPSMIKTDTLKHMKRRRSSGSGTARMRSDKLKEQKSSPRGSPRQSRGSPRQSPKRQLPKVPLSKAPPLTSDTKKRGEELLRNKSETLQERPRSVSSPAPGSTDKLNEDQNSSNVSSVYEDTRNRSQSDVTESFHTPTGQLQIPSVTGSDEKSPVSDTPMQFTEGVPRSESKSKEKKSRLSLIRRNKDIKRRNAVRSSVLPDDLEIVPKKSTTKSTTRKTKKKSKKREESSHDELDEVDGATATPLVFPEPDILDGLKSRRIPTEKLTPRSRQNSK